MAKWSIETEYIQSCNCDYGCPCNFNALPTTGSCEALNGYHIRKGAFNGTKLDGVTVAWGLWWPKAIHMGNGVGKLYIDNANAAQRRAVEAIFSGKEGGGVFTVFNSTFAKTLPPEARSIDFHYDGYNSWFRVENVGEVRARNIKNPVTGADFQGEVVLPLGVNFKRAYVTAVDWFLKDEPFNMEHRNVSGFATVTKYTEKGPISSNPAATVRKAPRKKR